MNVRGAAVQGGLAALGLVVAYTTWQREPERAPGEVVVIDVNKGDVQKVRYDEGKGKFVELDRRKEPGEEEPRVWLHLSADPQRKTPERQVPGNEGAERLWAKFAPLRATRGLGVLKGDKLKEVGLDAPKKKLTVTARGVTHVYDVGTSPFGVSDPYVRDAQDGRVYVLGGGVLSDLGSAGIRLVDRALHGFKPGDFDGFVVTAGSKSRAFAVQPTENMFAAKVTAKATGKVDDMAKNWHDKLWRTFVTDVLGKGEKPDKGAPEVGCKVEYTWHGKSKGFIEVGRITPPQTQSTAQPPPPEVWARTERTASWDKLSGSADQLLKECGKIAGGE